MAGLEAPMEYYDGLHKLYEHMKSVFVGGLDRLGFEYTEPEGAYYVMVNVAKYAKGDDLAFCERMARELGVAAVPACTFFKEDQHDWVRFHFAKRDETLNEALERLSGIDRLS